MRQLFLMMFFLGALPAVHAAEDIDWVRQRIKELQPSPKEKRFDEIGWAGDIREAKRLAKHHLRPIFLFTHDGRMNIGRC